MISAAERDPLTRARWCEEIAAIASKDLVFIDETSATIAMTRRYARAPKSQRAVGSVPRNHGKPTTLVAALSVDGLGAAMTLEGALDGKAFSVYLRKLLCPSLRPGQVVVMDNLQVHKSEWVRELIEEVGCSLLFLPPYSPDFAPIELAYSKIKEALRAAGARTQSALDTAITKAIDSVTTADSIAWFQHCGYMPT